jgi:hypothetical protein
LRKIGAQSIHFVSAVNFSGLAVSEKALNFFMNQLIVCFATMEQIGCIRHWKCNRCGVSPPAEATLVSDPLNKCPDGPFSPWKQSDLTLNLSQVRAGLELCIKFVERFVHARGTKSSPNKSVAILSDGGVAPLNRMMSFTPAYTIITSCTVNSASLVGMAGIMTRGA